VPPGWGEPVYGKLDAEIAAAMMSINAAKGVEIGDGFASVMQRGSLHRDEASAQGFLSNHAGGILGGISSGQQVVVSVAFKPTSSLRLPARGVDVRGNEVEVVTTGRHDPCVGVRATPICEAMLALVLMDQALRHRAQCGDVGEVAPRIPGEGIAAQAPLLQELEVLRMMGGKLKVAVVGATGAVGEAMRAVLAERRFPAEVVALASARSAGDLVAFGDDEVLVQELAS